MSDEQQHEHASEELAVEVTGADLLRPLVSVAVGVRASLERLAGPVIGELVAMADGGRVPLVCYGGQPTLAALRAESIPDLHGAHIGRRVLLCFDQGDPARPIVVGVLQEDETRVLPREQAEVEVISDGQRLILSAKQQIVIRCGRSSITLTQSGKVLIQGDYVVSCSTGTNRIKGGSVQIN